MLKNTVIVSMSLMDSLNPKQKKWFEAYQEMVSDELGFSGAAALCLRIQSCYAADAGRHEIRRNYKMLSKKFWTLYVSNSMRSSAS